MNDPASPHGPDAPPELAHVGRPDSDLTLIARIRDAALDLFSKHGVTGVSIRDVAKAAGASAGAVQHHFQTKQQLVDAVETFVQARMLESFGVPVAGASPTENTGTLNVRISDFIRQNPAIFAYMGRSLLEGDKAGLHLFQHLFRLVREQADASAEAGLLRPDVDRDWAALHLILIDIGTYLFAQAVEACLGDAPMSAPGLLRMGKATEGLFLHGVYRDAAPPE